MDLLVRGGGQRADSGRVQNGRVVREVFVLVAGHDCALPRWGPGDVITAEVVVTSIRADKPVTTLSTTIANQDGVVVLDGTAVVWRDPAVTKG